MLDPHKLTVTQTIQHARFNTKCLVSVRDVGEVHAAIAAGVHWIDLKNPQAGSLGAPDAAVAHEVAQVLSEFPNRSVALGELHELFGTSCLLDTRDPASVAAAIATATPIAKGFPVAKVGLSGLVSPNITTTDLREIPTASQARASEFEASVKQAVWVDCLSALAVGLWQQCGTRLVPVIYADAELANSPNAVQVLEAARHIAAPYLLIDTYMKDGRSLLDWLNPSQLVEICRQAEAYDCRVIAAGSLDVPAVEALRDIDFEAFAVRGAVCRGNRTEGICPRKLAEWMNRFEYA